MRSGGVLLEESVRVVEGEETGLKSGPHSPPCLDLAVTGTAPLGVRKAMGTQVKRCFIHIV